jgi:hypothetical protein
MMNPPCPPSCPHRSVEPNCHTDCKVYLDWRVKKDQENTQRRVERSRIAYRIDAIERMKKR